MVRKSVPCLIICLVILATDVRAAEIQVVHSVFQLLPSSTVSPVLGNVALDKSTLSGEGTLDATLTALEAVAVPSDDLFGRDTLPVHSDTWIFGLGREEPVIDIRRLLGIEPTVDYSTATFQFWTVSSSEGAMGSYQFDRTIYLSAQEGERLKAVAWYACMDEPETAEAMLFVFGIDVGSGQVIRMGQGILESINYEGLTPDAPSCEEVPCRLPKDISAAPLRDVRAVQTINWSASTDFLTSSWTGNFLEWVKDGARNGVGQRDLLVVPAWPSIRPQPRNSWAVALFDGQGTIDATPPWIVCDPPKNCEDCPDLCKPDPLACTTDPVALSLPPSGKLFIPWCPDSPDPCCNWITRAGLEVTIRSVRGFELRVLNMETRASVQIAEPTGQGEIHLSLGPRELDRIGLENIGLALIPSARPASFEMRKIWVHLRPSREGE